VNHRKWQFVSSHAAPDGASSIDTWYIGPVFRSWEGFPQRREEMYAVSRTESKPCIGTATMAWAKSGSML